MCYAINTLPNQERRHFIEMGTKTAFNPSTGEKYRVEMPAPEEVKNAILELEFPPEGIRMKDAVDPLAENLRLTDGQRRAEIRPGRTVFHYRVVHPAFQDLLREGELVQPNGKRTPYCLSPTTPRPPNSEPVLDSDPPVPVEKPYQGIRKTLEEALLQELRQMDPTVFEQLVSILSVKWDMALENTWGALGTVVLTESLRIIGSASMKFISKRNVSK